MLAVLLAVLGVLRLCHGLSVDLRAVEAGAEDLNRTQLAYTIRIALGEPKQYIDVRIDPNYPYFWVPGNECKLRNCMPYCAIESFCALACNQTCCTKPDPEGAGPCADKHTYDPTASKALPTHVTWSAEYSGKTVAGKLYQDVLHLGSHEDSFKLAEALFAVLDYYPDALASAPFDGVLGLGRESSSFAGLQTVVEQMGDLYNDSSYTLWLGKEENANPVGSITFAQPDHKHCSLETITVPLKAGHGWEFAVQGFKVGDSDIGTSAVGHVSLSEEWILVPSEVFGGLVTATEAKHDPDSREYKVDCDAELPSLSFLSKGTRVRLTAAEYVQRRLVEQDLFSCTLCVRPAADDALLVLGRPFLHAFCHTYDARAAVLRFSHSLA